MVAGAGHCLGYAAHRRRLANRCSAVTIRLVQECECVSRQLEAGLVPPSFFVQIHGFWP
jgi:hypothetical protein